MARPKRTDRATVATETLALRLTEDDRAALDRLVEATRASVADTGAELTAASYVRGLIRREARRLDAGEPMTTGQRLVHSPPVGGDEARAKALVLHAKADGRSQAEVAQAIGLAPASLSRWLKGKAPLAKHHVDALLTELEGAR